MKKTEKSTILIKVNISKKNVYLRIWVGLEFIYIVTRVNNDIIYRFNSEYNKKMNIRK